jgi:hypothetical protein
MAKSWALSSGAAPDGFKGTLASTSPLPTAPTARSDGAPPPTPPKLTEGWKVAPWVAAQSA